MYCMLMRRLAIVHYQVAVVVVFFKSRLVAFLSLSLASSTRQVQYLAKTISARIKERRKSKKDHVEHQCNNDKKETNKTMIAFAYEITIREHLSCSKIQNRQLPWHEVANKLSLVINVLKYHGLDRFRHVKRLSVHSIHTVCLITDSCNSQYAFRIV